MSLLIFALIVVVITAMLVWACQYLPLPGPLSWVVPFIIILIAALIVMDRAGLV